jgi:hypothetical protein
VTNDNTNTNVRDVMLVKVSIDGNVEWTQRFGSSDGDDNSAAVHVLPDGRIVVAATLDLKTKRKLALIVLNSDGHF